MKLFYHYFTTPQKYAPILELQEKIRNALPEHKDVAGFVLFLEHHHVYTMGIRTKMEHLLLSERQLEEKGIELYRIRRGGDITYHGPGQLVIYPVIHLHRSGKGSVSNLVSGLGEVIAETMRSLGVADAQWSKNPSGVWTKRGKIAAVGFHFRKFIGTHGFAINIHPDLSYFTGIIPCGITEKGVTSLLNECGRSYTVDAVQKVLLRNIMSYFNNLQCEERDPWHEL